MVTGAGVGVGGDRLAGAAQAIGDTEEYERCAQFLNDSDPSAAKAISNG